MQGPHLANQKHEPETIPFALIRATDDKTEPDWSPEFIRSFDRCAQLFLTAPNSLAENHGHIETSDSGPTEG